MAALSVLFVMTIYVIYAMFKMRAAATIVFPVLLITSQFLLVEQSVAGIPLRIAATLLATAYVIYSIFISKTSILYAKGAGKIVSAWVGFSIVLLLMQLINGSAALSDEYVIDSLSRYGFALISFLAVGTCSRMSARPIALWLFILALMNVVFAALQLIGVEFAIWFHSDLFPILKLREAELIEEGLNSSFGYLPGLSIFSIATGYSIAVFAWLGAAIGKEGGAFARGTLPIIIGGILCVIGGGIILSRSTILAGVFGVILMFFLYQSENKSIKGKHFAWKKIILPTLIIIGCWIIFQIFAFIVPGGERILKFNDSERSDIYDNGFSLILENLIIGSSVTQKSLADVDIGAHNVVFNALLQGGILSFVLLMIFVFISFSESLKRVYAADGRDRNFLAALFCAATIYVLKSFFHNESFVTSGIQFMIVLGLLIGASARPVGRSAPRPRREVYGYPLAFQTVGSSSVERNNH